MSRRRYLSTDISKDKQVNRLAIEHGDFAALLYTWMIPHAADDGSLCGDPEELMFSVLPGRRDKAENDIEAALDGMESLGLIDWNKETKKVQFPRESFYRYQTYIPESKREPAQNAEGQRDGAENTFSPSPSPSPSLSPSPSPNSQEEGEIESLTLTERTALSLLKSVPGYKFAFQQDLDFIRELLVDFPGLDVTNQLKRWRDYKRDKPLMKNSNARLQLRNWMENAVRYAAKNGAVVASRPPLRTSAAPSQHDILFGKS